MGIKNYTTEVPASRSISEIQNILVKHGARRIELNYNASGEPDGLCFIVMTKDGEADKEIPFRLPVNIKALEVLLAKGPVQNYRRWDSEYQRQRLEKLHAQAVRVGWRIVKDWIDSQMAYIETTMATLDQVFLPYLMVKDRQTLYEAISSRGFLLAEGKG